MATKTPPARELTFERTPIWDHEFAQRWAALHGQGPATKPATVKRKPRTSK